MRIVFCSIIMVLSTFMIGGCATAMGVVVDKDEFEISVELSDEEDDIAWVNATEIERSGRVIVEERKIGDFNRISLAGVGNVVIFQGDAETLSVEADAYLMDYIRTEVSEDVLILGFTEDAKKLGLDVEMEEIKFNVNVRDLDTLTISGVGDIFMPTLDSERFDLVIDGVGKVNVPDIKVNDLSIEINGVGKVDGAIEASQMNAVINGVGDLLVSSLVVGEFWISVAGVGDIDIDSLVAERLDVHITGAAEFDVAGEVVEQNVSIFDHCDYFAPRLESQSATVRIRGGTADSAVIWVSEYLNVDITGPHTVEYYGDPVVGLAIEGSGELVSMGAP